MCGKKWSSLDLNISPLSSWKLLLLWSFHLISFCQSQRAAQRSAECPLCLCNVSAAVAGLRCVLKSVLHMCQLSSCHPKSEKGRSMKKKYVPRLTLLEFARMAKHWRSGSSVARRVNALFLESVHAADVSLSKNPSCWEDANRLRAPRINTDGCHILIDMSQPINILYSQLSLCSRSLCPES